MSDPRARSLKANIAAAFPYWGTVDVTQVRHTIESIWDQFHPNATPIEVLFWEARSGRWRYGIDVGSRKRGFRSGHDIFFTSEPGAHHGDIMLEHRWVAEHELRSIPESRITASMREALVAAKNEPTAETLDRLSFSLKLWSNTYPMVYRTEQHGPIPPPPAPHKRHSRDMSLLEA